MIAFATYLKVQENEMSYRTDSDICDRVPPELSGPLSPISVTLTVLTYVGLKVRFLERSEGHQC